ncbi:MAG: hypothetical protein PF588_08545 [Candidatus Kapabacteria bacterium]|jgi:hypothetical protein|nr:hypothetical protein [Candidatus Kapabacteria bacterium]
MSNKDLIRQYMDGELDNVGEDVLFSEMANDRALRSDFNQHIEIDNAARTDMSRINVPAESSRTIFSTLGFAIPATISGSVVNGPVGLWSRYGKTVIAACSAACVTALMFVVTNDPAEENIQTASNASRPAVEAVIQAPVVSSFADAAADNQASNVIVANNVESVTTTVPAVINTTANSSNINTLSVTPVIENENVRNDAPIQVLAKSNYDLARNEISLGRSNSVFMPNNYQQDDLDLLSNDISGRWIVELSNNSSLNDNVIVPGSETGVLENLNLALMYKSTPNWSFGVQLGRETFNKIYDLDANTNALMNRGCWTYGAIAKYSTDFMSLMFPYIQGFAGGSEFGFLSKLRVGTEIPVNNMISLNAGLEYGGLFSNIYGNINRIDKLSFVGSMSFNF